MKYLVDLDSGRKAIDLPRFAADLAKELNGQRKPDPEHPGAYQYIRLLGDGATDELRLSADNYKKRVHVSINAPDVPYNDWSAYDKAQRVESASVNPDGRSIGAIARDIKKRVVDANMPALAARRAYAAKQKQNRSDMLGLFDAMQAAYPMLRFRMSDDKQSASFYSGVDARHIDGQIDASGRVSIRSLDRVDVETFAKIMAALNTAS